MRGCVDQEKECLPFISRVSDFLLGTSKLALEILRD